MTGWPVMTVPRGQGVMEDGRVTGDPPAGRFLRRSPSPYAVLAAAAAGTG